MAIAAPSIVVTLRSCEAFTTTTPKTATARSQAGLPTTSSASSPPPAPIFGRCNTVATHTFGAGDRDVDVIVGGRYLDKYEKRSGTWKFLMRKNVTDWAHVNDPSSVDLSHPITRDTPRGTPDANDPSYQFFSLLLKDADC
jgi:hypothetical protein